MTNDIFIYKFLVLGFSFIIISIFKVFYMSVIDSDKQQKFFNINIFIFFFLSIITLLFLYFGFYYSYLLSFAFIFIYGIYFLIVIYLIKEENKKKIKKTNLVKENMVIYITEILSSIYIISIFVLILRF